MVFNAVQLHIYCPLAFWSGGGQLEWREGGGYIYLNRQNSLILSRTKFICHNLFDGPLEFILFCIFFFSFFFLFSFKFIPIYFSHASILPHITFFCYLLVFLMSNAGHVFHFFEVVFFWSAIFTFTLRNFLTSFNLLSSYSLWCFTFWS